MGIGDCREHAMLHETVVIVVLNLFVQICKEVSNKKGIHGEKICLYLVSYETWTLDYRKVKHHQ